MLGWTMPARNSFERISPTNRSVERALAILRAFRPGLAALGNQELAERTGLPRATVSRLTQTLVENGFLRYDFMSGNYRLGVPLLSLAHAFRLDCEVLNIALPRMREVAEGLRINVGLAMADGDDMVYLESVRRNRSGLFRHVTSGSRVPIELTSLGRAHLSTLDESKRTSHIDRLLAHQGGEAEITRAAIQTAIDDLLIHGYCKAAWQAGITSIAAPLLLKRESSYAFNISFASEQFDDQQIEKNVAPLLLSLVEHVCKRLAASSDPDGVR